MVFIMHIYKDINYIQMHSKNYISIFVKTEEREYSILLVMSELSIVQCDRVLGLWIAGTRASSVNGELPWRCCGRWTVRWTAVKGSRDRSLDRAAAVVSTPCALREFDFASISYLLCFACDDFLFSFV